MEEYKKVLNYVLRQREKAPICQVCKKKLFDFNDCLDQYFYRLNNKGDLSSKEINNIYTKIFYEYPFKKQDENRMAKHHVNYMLNITIDVCSKCHGKIHGTNEEKYRKFKPHDKKTM